MLPSWSQFRRWSYPSKFGFVSFFIASLLSIIFWLFPDTGKRIIARATGSDYEHELVGTWKGTTHYNSANGSLTASGYTRLLESGQYNYSGDIELRAPDGTTLQFGAQASGTWKGTSTGYEVISGDVKTLPRLLKQPGKADIDLSDAFFRERPHLLPRLEDLTPRGAAQPFTVSEITSTRLRAYGRDISGNAVTYEANRE